MKFYLRKIKKIQVLDCLLVEIQNGKKYKFNYSNINVNLVPYSNTFEGQDRNSGEQVLFFTRVLMDEKEENSFFTVFKFFGTYHVFCRKTKNNKWEIRKVIPDDNNKLRLE